MMAAGSSMGSLGELVPYFTTANSQDKIANQGDVSRGRTIGGVQSRNDCAELPQNLQAGCYWRWNWARGDINGWNVDYKQISCPAELESKSGCSAV